MVILAVGDVIGESGCDFIRRNLRRIRAAEGADVVIVNAENAASGSGLDKKTAELLLSSGADVLTGGNHTFRKYAALPLLDENEYVLRPHNFPSHTPGKGWCTLDVNGKRVLVISMCGQLFMNACYDSPFGVTEKLLGTLAGKYDIAVCDFHAEATSEKRVFSKVFDGRIAIVYGTHTHVQTADERLTPMGGAFISDIGMCGDEESVIGITFDSAVSGFTDNIRAKSVTASESITLRGAVFTVDDETGYVTQIKRIKYEEN